MFLFMDAYDSQSQYEKLLKNLVLQYWLLQLQLVAYQKKSITWMKELCI